MVFSYDILRETIIDEVCAIELEEYPTKVQISSRILYTIRSLFIGKIAIESLEREETKFTRGNPQLVVDGDLHEMANMVVWSVSSYKSGKMTIMKPTGIFCVFGALVFQLTNPLLIVDSNQMVHNHSLLTFSSKRKLNFRGNAYSSFVSLIIKSHFAFEIYNRVGIYIDFNLDESYRPSKISIRVGDGLHNLHSLFSKF
uniref:DOC domain-containing protein n=1 Tax=Lactuca sativa TaxID=4236 RepID=A0A9R1XM03_LACSA|nr:hypothetical protein LSAT_V11C200093840 [Lactuca sativa]